ncbi:hypothetical protein EJB05_57079, partial [Eragrostis curvula]
MGLCGGIAELDLPLCLPKSKEPSKRNFHHIFRVTFPIASIVLFLSVVLIFISLKKKPRLRSTTLAGFHFIDDRHPRVSYADLKCFGRYQQCLVANHKTCAVMQHASANREDVH